jgi:hypothetical protein
MRLMRGATYGDWLFLRDLQAAPAGVYILDWGSASAFTAQEIGCRLPWYVSFALTRYSKKHIFVGNKFPQVEQIHLHVRSFTNKLLWRWQLRQSRDAPTDKRFRSRDSAFCLATPDNCPPELVMWTKLFAETVSNAAKTAVFQARAKHTRFGNRPPLLSAALQWLREAAVAPVPTDKDGGFCLVARSCLELVHKSTLDGTTYALVNSESLPSWESVMRTYRGLACEVEKLEETPQLAQLLCRSLRLANKRCRERASSEPLSPLEPCIRTLQVTVKTHKPPGEVSARDLHGGPSQAFESLARWVAAEVAATVPDSFLLQNSFQLVRDLKDAKFVPSIRVVTIDVKHFFYEW